MKEDLQEIIKEKKLESQKRKVRKSNKKLKKKIKQQKNQDENKVSDSFKKTELKLIYLTNQSKLERKEGKQKQSSIWTSQSSKDEKEGREYKVNLDYIYYYMSYFKVFNIYTVELRGNHLLKMIIKSQREKEKEKRILKKRRKVEILE